MLRAVRIAVCAFALMSVLAFIGCSSSASGSANASASTSATAVESSISGEAAASQSGQAANAVSAASTATADSLAPGKYSVKFETDSNMFHVNEADEGRAILTVDEQGMTAHIRLVSKKITMLYEGTAEQAQADEAGQIPPTTDKVTYSDGYEKEVYGFDVPVPALDQEFDVAILGSKDKWYDHKVTVSDPIPE